MQPTTTPTRLTVCTMCRHEGEPALPLEGRSGARLFAALQALAGHDATLEIAAAECLSVCRRPCTIGLTAPGKWTYVYGDLPPEAGAATILEAARLYAETPDGLIPWKLRSEAIKKGVVVRLPPDPRLMPAAPPALEPVP